GPLQRAPGCMTASSASCFDPCPHSSQAALVEQLVDISENVLGRVLRHEVQHDIADRVGNIDEVFGNRVSSLRAGRQEWQQLSGAGVEQREVRLMLQEEGLRCSRQFTAAAVYNH